MSSGSPEDSSPATGTMRPLRMALIGGGGAGFIGKVHVTAATLDRQAELVAGAFSSDPSRAKAAATSFGVDPDRAYRSYQELLETESALPADRRIDFVSIATPNHTHAEIATAALRAGFHVACDKPMTTNLVDAAELAQVAAESGRVFLLTHNYSGYPMIRQAREMIRAGELGDLIGVRASYVQGWMHGIAPDAPAARGAWKSDPDKNGRAGSLGDVGTHAFHLARFVSGLTPGSLMSEMKSYSPHHQLDDYGHSVLRFAEGATGLITWSQVSHGRLNDLSLEVDGTRGSLAWRQEDPNQLVVRALGQPTRTFERNPNASYTLPTAADACRLPGGHPEAFFEAFANLYRDAFAAMRQVDDGQPPPRSPIYPSAGDGVEGVQFMTRCLESRDDGSSWRAWSH